LFLVTRITKEKYDTAWPKQALSLSPSCSPSNVARCQPSRRTQC
jgi:hypothetical protein